MAMDMLSYSITYNDALGRTQKILFFLFFLWLGGGKVDAVLISCLDVSK
jgi:hypothetical protein